MFPEDWPADVILELTDPKFATWTHGNKGTYQHGCHGPLCRKNERDIRKQWYRERQAALGLPVRKRRSPISDEEEAFLEKILKWHWKERSEGRSAPLQAIA